MGFIRNFRRDFAQAVNELLPETEEKSARQGKKKNRADEPETEIREEEAGFAEPEQEDLPETKNGKRDGRGKKHQKNDRNKNERTSVRAAVSEAILREEADQLREKIRQSTEKRIEEVDQELDEEIDRLSDAGPEGPSDWEMASEAEGETAEEQFAGDDFGEYREEDPEGYLEEGSEEYPEEGAEGYLEGDQKEESEGYREEGSEGYREDDTESDGFVFEGLEPDEDPDMPGEDQSGRNDQSEMDIKGFRPEDETEEAGLADPEGDLTDGDSGEETFTFVQDSDETGTDGTGELSAEEDTPADGEVTDTAGDASEESDSPDMDDGTERSHESDGSHESDRSYGSETKTERDLEKEKYMAELERQAGLDEPVTGFAADCTYITAKTKIRGNIETDGDIDLIGKVFGEVTCGGKLIVGGVIQGNVTVGQLYANQAKIEGDIHAEGDIKVGVGTVIIGNLFGSSAVIAGAVQGDIDINGPVIVDSSAVIVGNIRSKSVQINNGAIIEGFCSQSYLDVDVKKYFSSDKIRLDSGDAEVEDLMPEQSEEDEKTGELTEVVSDAAGSAEGAGENAAEPAEEKNAGGDVTGTDQNDRNNESHHNNHNNQNNRNRNNRNHKK